MDTKQTAIWSHSSGDFHDAGPEKTGGGSRRALATILSTSYKPSSQRLRSKSFEMRGGAGLLSASNCWKDRPVYGWLEGSSGVVVS